MSLDLTKITPPTPPQSKASAARFSTQAALGVVGLAGLITVGVLWQRGYSPQRLWTSPPPILEMLEVVAKPLAVVVVETGTVESASNTTVKCQVEALVGLVGGSTSSGGRSATGAAGAAGGATTTQAAAAPAMSMTASTSKSATAGVPG